MRGMFGLVGLVVVLAIVGVLVQKQTAAARKAAPAATASPAVTEGAPTTTVRDQSQPVQQQVKQQVEGILLQARPVPGEEN